MEGLMAKYLVGQKFRLVDLNAYLDANMIFEPEDKYVQTSRSMQAALRSGWLQKISDSDAAKHQAMMDKALTTEYKGPDTATPSVNKPNNGLPKMIDDMKPEDIADEVVGNNAAIIVAREKRRREAIAKVAKPIVGEHSVEPENVEVANTEIAPEVEVPQPVTTKVSKSAKSEAALIKHEIKSRIKSRRIVK
jgi:hypothetical protein